MLIFALIYYLRSVTKWNNVHVAKLYIGSAEETADVSRCQQMLNVHWGECGV